MFGLEDQKKKKKAPEFVFELEKELKNSKIHQQIKQKVEGCIQRIKEILRSGENKEEFDQFGTLLHGYTSLLKVMMRLTPKGK
jgi:actin-like ATPase involved in cell morphogenesis